MTFPSDETPVAWLKVQAETSAPACVRTVARERIPLVISQTNASVVVDPVNPTITVPLLFAATAWPCAEASGVGLAEPTQRTANPSPVAPTITVPSSLIALASAVLSDSHEPELVLATANDGLLAFNGRAFRQIIPYDPDARAITAILPDASGHLLIGTKKRGVLAYDGKHITVLHPTLGNGALPLHPRR